MGKRVSQSVKQPTLLARTDRGKRGRGRGKKRNLPRKDLPTNSEAGKCYVRCTTPDVYVNEKVKVQVKPSYKIIKTIPVKFEKRTEKVLVKSEEKKLKVIPVKWGKESVDYIKKDGASTLSVMPASFNDDYETIEIKPKYAQWEMGASNPDY